MPPKTAPLPLADQIIEALSNDAVAKAISQAIGPFIALTITELIKPISDSIKSLVNENKELRNKIVELEKNNSELRERVKVIEDHT